jgi:hypothetical protein
LPTPDDERIAVRRHLARGDNHGGAAAIFLERVGREDVGDKPAVGELADAARLVAGDAVK